MKSKHYVIVAIDPDDPHYGSSYADALIGTIVQGVVANHYQIRNNRTPFQIGPAYSGRFIVPFLTGTILDNIGDMFNFQRVYLWELED